MKSDNISKISESNHRTILCTEDNNISSYSKNCIRLKFSDNTYSHYDISTLSCINPIFFAHILNQSETEILLPSFITPNLLMEFLFIIKNGFNELDESTKDNTTKILSILTISDFFQNESISIQLVRDIVLNKLTPNNSFIYLQYSYDKLNKIITEGTESEGVWFDLFYKSLETIGTCPFILFKHNDIINKLDSKVLYELLQKCFAHLVLGNYILIESDALNNNTIDSNMSNEIEAENYFDSGQETSPLNHHYNDKNIIDNEIENQHLNDILMTSPQQNQQQQQSQELKINFTTLNNITRLIEYLYKVYQWSENNFFDLLTCEYMSVFSNDSLKELNDSPHPTFQIQIPYEFDHCFYKEYTIDLMVNKKRVILVVFYQQNDDSFNVCIKLGDKAQCDEKFCFQIFSFISIVKLNEGNIIPNSYQSSFKSLSNNKSMHCIMKFSNFKSTFKYKKKKFDKNNRNNKTCILHKSNEFYVNNDGIINNHDISDHEEDENDEENEDNESDYLNEHNNNSDYFTLKIYLKLCFIHSVLSSYLLQNFNVLAYQPNINKLSKQMMMMIVKNKYLNKKKEDDILSAMINWLDDEINSKEDITELFDLIHWKDLNEELIFEFVMKYAHMINIEDYESKIIKGIEQKYNKDKSCKEAVFPMRNLLMGVYTAAKKVDYSSVYTKMHKEIKKSLAYKRSNLNDKANHIIDNNNSNSNSNSNSSNSNHKRNNITHTIENNSHHFNHKLSNSQESQMIHYYIDGKSNNDNGLSNKTQVYDNSNHFGNVYKSKDVNTLNKFIISHCNNNDRDSKNNPTKKHIRNIQNQSRNNMPSQSNQSLSLTKVLVKHNVNMNKPYKSSLKKYSSCQVSEKNYSPKKMSHLKQYSLQIQTDNALTQNTKKNLINLCSAAANKITTQICTVNQTNFNTNKTTNVLKPINKSLMRLENDDKKQLKTKQNSFMNSNNKSLNKMKIEQKKAITLFSNKQSTYLKK